MGIEKSAIPQHLYTDTTGRGLCQICGWSRTFHSSLTPENPAALPVDASARKQIPITTGALDYFPAALAEVAKVSLQGNIQHNGPDAPLHHARGKSTDHADCIVRHLVDRGTRDVDGQRHTAKAAWRCLALLQEELEAEGAPLARAARLPEENKK